MAKSGKKKPGRKRKQDVARTPSGRISRAKGVNFEDAPQQVVWQARRRQQHGPMPITKATTSVGPEEAKRLSQRGSVLARMLADGLISKDQLAAGEDYCQRYMRYAALVGLPRHTPQGSSWGEINGLSSPDRTDEAMIAKREHAVDCAALTQCSAGVSLMVQRVCVSDEDGAPNLLKEGLDALIKARA